MELKIFLGTQLKRNATFGDAVALLVVLSALGMETEVKLEAVREIREAVEGKATQRLQIPEQDEPQDVDELRMRMREKLINMMVERPKLYGMPLPALSEVADQAGVDLGIPREDESKGRKPQ